MEIKLRLRHPSGDLGPFEVAESLTVAQVKETVFSQWPSDGPLSKENPSSAADLRILCAGKFLENARALKEYRREMGDPEAGAVVTMHVLVRPAAASGGGKAGAAGGAKEGAEAARPPKSGCGCVIC